MQKFHPSSIICIWLIFIITLQKLNFYGDFLLFLLLFFSSKNNKNNKKNQNFLQSLIKTLYKTKWLFVGIWLSTAYYTPGDLIADNLFWLPTQQGIFSAWEYSARLVVMMTCLVWLNSWLNQQDFLLGLFGVLMPFRKIFGEQNIKIFVLRLALIFENFENFKSFNNKKNNNKNNYKFDDLIQLLKNKTINKNSKNFIEISWKKFTINDFLIIIFAIFISIIIFYLTKNFKF